MKLQKLLTSPLSASAAVVAGLTLLAIPLRQLTSAPPVQRSTAVTTPSADALRTWIKLKLLTPSTSVTLSNAAGEVLWKLADKPAGDVETDIIIPLVDGAVDLTLQVDFTDPTNESAVFLTLLPDGLEEQTQHAIGSGEFTEVLHFLWPIH